MIFRQLFHVESGTYSYLLAGRQGGEALIIDPVVERVDRYLQLLNELDLKLMWAIDTHVHADHITALGELRNRTKCITVMGEQSPVDVVSMRVKDGDLIEVEGLRLTALYTPGHTIDSYSYLMADRVFTGDTLLIRGTGRTDFQSGSARAQYDSLFNKLLKLPADMLVYPGHDYKGDTVSAIGEEKRWNPRLQVKSIEAYEKLMGGLNLPNPKMMDVVVPANVKIGLGQGALEHAAWALGVADVMAAWGSKDSTLVDLREEAESKRHDVIPGSVHAPYTELDGFIAPGGVLREMARATGRRLIFYCAFGERSRMAVEAAQAQGLSNVCHLVGGIDAWKKAGGAIEANP
ncbi:MAG: MBL fold metallo-hydrolase [Alphaproteobacteria bacterium]|nr:MBL fold metallo-hydrolase [Alphaproteobacteria bacterium]